MSRVCNLYQGSLCGDLSCDGDCSECGNPKAAHEGEPIINCGSAICLFSSMGNDERTDTQCKCFDAAGFHGPLAMKAQQMLREVLILRAKLDAAPRWISPAERLPAKNETVVAMVDGDGDPTPMLLVYMPSHNEDPMPWRLYGTYAWFNSVSVLKWAPIPSEET